MLLERRAMMFKHDPQETKLYILKNGTLQNGYTWDMFTKTSASYSAGNYIQISHNASGKVIATFDAPKKYMFVTVYAYAYPTGGYSFRPTINGTTWSNRMRTQDGSLFYARTNDMQTLTTFRYQYQVSGLCGYVTYFGGYRITDWWFSDDANDY